MNRIAPREELEEATARLAGEALARASSESIARTKALLLDLVGRPLDDALERAAAANAAARATEDCRHGIATFLDTKAPPRWRSDE